MDTVNSCPKSIRREIDIFIVVQNISNLVTHRNSISYNVHAHKFVYCINYKLQFDEQLHFVRRENSGEL